VNWLTWTSYVHISTSCWIPMKMLQLLLSAVISEYGRKFNFVTVVLLMQQHHIVCRLDAIWDFFACTWKQIRFQTCYTRWGWCDDTRCSECTATRLGDLLCFTELSVIQMHSWWCAVNQIIEKFWITGVGTNDTLIFQVIESFDAVTEFFLIPILCVFTLHFKILNLNVRMLV